jgi:hypothetical protein
VSGRRSPGLPFVLPLVTVYLSESVWRDLKVLAAKTDSTIDGLMRRGLDHVFAEHNVNRGAADCTAARF